jgi:hypothetical protein
MTRKESDFKESQAGSVDFVYPNDDAPRDTVDRLRQTAGEFAFEILKLHKPRVAMIRIAALQHLVDPSEPVSKVAQGLGVSRQFFNRVKAAVGISLRYLLCKTG